MKDYSIEYLTEKINSKKTKMYFKEVSSSYFNSNYRAAIVTLYPIVINDILQKLEALDEIFSDPVAKDILDKIKSFQIRNPNNPEWERDIIKQVKERTNLIDNVDYAHIEALKNDRHLCAHSVISKEEKLYIPNKETVACHIRNMLESFLVKPPILSKKILSTIILDIASKESLLIDKESLEKYVISKYLNNLNSSTEIRMFRDLWKFVYKIDNENCDYNRLINFRTLYLLYKRNKSECIIQIENEKEYFSNIRNDESIINFFIRFIAENEFLYSKFREDVHLLVSKHIEINPSGKTVSWFLSYSYTSHLETVKSLILNNFNNVHPYEATSNAYQRLIKIGYAKGYKNEVNDFIVWKYINSKSYTEADQTFEYVLLPFLDNLTKEEVKKMCIGINKNAQTYDRKLAIIDHVKLKNIILNRFKDQFDFSKYKNIFK